MKYLQFILIGLAVAFVGEYVNNFIVGIPGVDPVGNFIFAMSFYLVFLTIAYRYQRRYLVPHTFRSWVKYGLLFGVGIGLVLTEWILVGNHSLSPNATALITQVSMVSYHTLVYLLPAISLHLPPVWQPVRKVAGVATILSLGISLLAAQLASSPAIVLAISIFSTYFILYNAVFLYMWYHLRRYTKKLS